MFKWLKRSDGLEDVEKGFLGMLRDGRRVFDLAMQARLSGVVTDSPVNELNRLEERTDETERRIRRQVLVHASVHGATDITACLMYMSVTKDAERISDLSKNLFGVARTVKTAPPEDLRLELEELYVQISAMIEDAALVFEADDLEGARAWIEKARGVMDRCHARIEDLLTTTDVRPQAAASVLTYRHLGRITAHALNAVSAVVMPLDQLDYPSEALDEGRP